MRELFESAGRELWRRKGRTLAGIFSYLLAVSLMVVLISVLISSKEAQSSILTSTGTHFVAFAPLQLNNYDQEKLITGTAGQPCLKTPLDPVSEGFLSCGVLSRILPLGLVDQVKEIPAVADATGYLSFRFQDTKDRHLFTVGGFDPSNTAAVSTNSCAASDLVNGRFLTAQDHGVAMLEEAYASARNMEVGTTVKVAGTTFPVIGIVNSGIRPAKADLYLTFDDAEQVINKRLKSPLFEEANLILVEVKNAKRQNEAMAGVKKLMKEGVISTYNCYKPAATVLGINEHAVWVLLIIIGLGTVIFSLRSQLAAVLERRHEIAILKAIGWSNRTVVMQILLESILQVFTGGLLGCLGGMLVLILLPAKIYSGVSGVGFTVPWLVMGAAFILALIGGIVAGIFPALSAARRNPAEVLRRI